MKLNDVYTLTEAANLWNISASNLRNALVKFNRFTRQIKNGTVKKSAGTWIVTRDAMEQVFGPMPQYQNEDTGAIVDAQGLHEMHAKEWHDMWENRNDSAGPWDDFSNEEAFMKYMKENDIDPAFHLIGDENDG